jgi:DNA-binding IclR family transcriptional regulator
MRSGRLRDPPALATMPLPGSAAPKEAKTKLMTRSVASAAEREQLRSLRRGLAVLEALAAHPAGATPKELSQALGLHLSTTYRLLNTLVAAGYAARCAGGALFRTGSRIAYVHHGFLEASRPPAGVVPFVHALQLTTGETAMFTQWEDDNVVATAIVDGSRPGSCPSGYIGLAGPAHSAAAGRALLARLPATQLEAYLDRQPTVPGSVYPLTDPGGLRAELEGIRQTGYALDRGTNPDVCCVAAPVSDQSGVVGSMSIIVPCTRFRREEAVFISVVCEVARATTALLRGGAARDERGEGDQPETDVATRAAIEAGLARHAEAMSRVG